MIAAAKFADRENNNPFTAFLYSIQSQTIIHPNICKKEAALLRQPLFHSARLLLAYL
jgi:hypothetical protein